MVRRNAAEVATGAVVILAAAAFLGYAVSSTGRGAAGGGYTLHARFDNIGSLATGADVRLAGVKVGSVTATAIDPKSYQAVVSFSVQDGLRLSTDSSAQIASAGLLSGAYLQLSPGGADTVLKDNGTVEITQSAASLEDLLGKFIFNVGSLADATQKQLQREQGGQGGGQQGGGLPDSPPGGGPKSP